MEIRGAAHVPVEGPVVVAANHESMLDPFVLASAIPRDLRYLSKEELWGRNRLLTWWLDDMGAIPVSRGRGDRHALAAASAALARGEAVGVFPEGGVSRDGRWHRGAARLALLTGAPLLPVRLLATYRALSAGRVGLPQLAVLIGEPIVVEPATPTIAAAKALTQRLQAAVESLRR